MVTPLTELWEDAFDLSFDVTELLVLIGVFVCNNGKSSLDSGSNDNSTILRTWRDSRDGRLHILDPLLLVVSVSEKIGPHALAC